MYVRTIYATGDPAKLKGVVDTLSTEGRELVSGEPGFRGMGVMVDREVGKLAVGTWWEDERSQQASDDRLRERRTAMIAPFAATAVTDVWEAVVFRPPVTPLATGAAFRMVRLEFDPSDADLLADAFENIALPKLQAMSGFAGGSLLMNSARNRGTVGAFYTDRVSLAASRAAVAAVRGETTKKAHVITRSVEEFDVALLSRVPSS